MSGGYACQCNNNKDENIVDCIPDEDRLILQVRVCSNILPDCEMDFPYASSILCGL